jgi:hypothetical protein
MRTGRFFWGAFFVVVGVLALSSNLDYLHLDLSYSWRLWPLILVFWGLSKFTQNWAVKGVFAGLNGLLFACIVVGFFSFQWINVSYDDDDVPRYSQHLSEPYDASIERATFNFSSGAGKFRVKSTTDSLIDAETESGLGRYDLDRYDDDGSTELTLRMRDSRSFRFFGKFRNRADIRLNDRPTWEMHFKAGASNLDLDLTPFKTRKVTIDAGVSTIRVKLGNRLDESDVRVKTGVSSVHLDVPATSGCEIRDDAHIGSTDFNGFEKMTGTRWQTDNFDSASKKIYIQIESGVSSIRVRRY